MRLSRAEKMEIIRMVEQSILSAKRALEELGVNRCTFYNWYRRSSEDGYDGLAGKRPNARRFWNKIPETMKEEVVQIALEHPDKSPRELAPYIIAWKLVSLGTDCSLTMISAIYRSRAQEIPGEAWYPAYSGAPYHPMTQGKIERFHRSMKNVVKLQNYFMPWELEQEIGRFMEYYNNERYHESLKNLKPVDVYDGRGKQILDRREQIKQRALRMKRE